MKINDKNYIYIDTKIEDEFRKRIAKLDGGLNISCVKLGDSDFDYKFSTNPTNIRTLNAPFRVNNIKYPLIYTGANSGLNGYITVFARKVVLDNEDVVAQSLYNFPQLENWQNGLDSPRLENGKKFDSLLFNESQMGYILYFQTILYNYIEPSSELLYRFNEKIQTKITFDGVEYIPNEWDIVLDENERVLVIDDKEYRLFNNSMFISKDFTGPLTSNIKGKIELLGELTRIKKTINFNI